jgi:hypothetical protein
LNLAQIAAEAEQMGPGANTDANGNIPMDQGAVEPNPGNEQ